MDFPTTYAILGVTCVVTFIALNNPKLLDALILWPPAVTRDRDVHRLATYGLVHADGAHLLFNMITLYFFGRQVEQLFVPYIGAGGFVLFYLSAIVVAMLPTYLRHRHDPRYRSLGASGAVSAVLFVFILVAPWSLIFVFFLPVPAILYALMYVGYSVWADRNAHDNINHSAHLAGAAYGVLFTVAMEPGVLASFFSRLLSPSFG